MLDVEYRLEMAEVGAEVWKGEMRAASSSAWEAESEVEGV
jgi:hypothetical protein